LSLLISESEYRKLPNYSYSQLSKFSREGFRKIKSLNKSDSSSSLISGGLVDCIVLGTKKEFENKYLISEVPISENAERVFKKLFECNISELSEIEDAYLNSICLEMEFYKGNYKMTTRIEKLKEYLPYWEILKNNPSKIIISKADFENAVEIKRELFSNSFTFNYFNNFGIFRHQFNQLKFTSSYHNYNLKIMIDKTIVDHKEKTIQPIDLKTTPFDEEDFKDSFIKYRYDIQAQLYSFVLENVLKQDPAYKDYKILPFKFIVISSFYKSPLIYTFNFTSFVELEGLEHWSTILPKLDWHMKNPNSKYSLKATKKQGEYNLNLTIKK
jgi:hypothetical protein